jgi:hypothetical protein
VENTPDLNHVYPAEVDGPGPDWYRELAEERGTPWPRGAYTARLTHMTGFALARQRMPQMWPCPKCGGPKVCPDLAATLPYRECGYSPAGDPYGPWVHQ